MICPTRLRRRALLLTWAALMTLSRNIFAIAFGVNLAISQTPLCWQSSSQIGLHSCSIPSKSTLLSATERSNDIDPRIGKRVGEIIKRFDLTPNKHDMFWLNRYVELEHYKEVNGDCLVPKRYPNNQPLGSWTNNQRTNYRYLMQNDNAHREKTKRQSNMKEWRIELFEEIGFEWEVTGWEDVWEQSFEKLVEYKKEHGNCDVPHDYEKTPRLGKWVNNQRSQYWLKQEGKESTLTDSRIKKLGRIGFQWHVNGPNVPWEERFEELKEFKNRFKHCNVPMNWQENRELSHWVNIQRREYRLLLDGKDSSMTDERIELLESIGFEWYINGPNVPWEKRFEQLEEFKQRFKHCNVPSKWNENPQLAGWVKDQRTQYRLLQEDKPSSMTKDRIQLLESIGFQWKLRNSKLS